MAITLDLILARFSPARTHLLIIEGSNSAKASVIWNMSLPVFVVVSIYLLVAVQPLASRCRIVPSRSTSERP
jgi:hypothetical protein